MSWDITQPETFLRVYLQKLAEEANSDRQAWHKDRPWTRLTRTAAMKAISTGKTTAKGVYRTLFASTEYFKLDVIGEEKTENEDFYDWMLRVAFEHENCTHHARWQQEFCKLTHVVADLKVLVAYDDLDTIEKKLETQINLMEAREMHRISRLRGSKWLFIFGPKRMKRFKREPFKAFKLEVGERRQCKAVPLDKEEGLSLMLKVWETTS